MCHKDNVVALIKRLDDNGVLAFLYVLCTTCYMFRYRQYSENSPTEEVVSSAKHLEDKWYITRINVYYTLCFSTLKGVTPLLLSMFLVVQIHSL